MNANDLEKTSLEFQMIYGESLDSRGPLELGDEPKDDDPLGMFREEIADKLSKAAAGLVSAATIVPSFDQIIGLTDRKEEFVISKHVPVENPEEMTFRKRARCSSGPGKVRLEKTMIDGEIWLFGFDDVGDEVFSRPFIEETAA